MANIETVSNLILKTGAHGDASRTAFSNYLSGFVDSEEELTPTTLIEFILYSLSFEYWHKHLSELVDTTIEILTGLESQNLSLGFDFEFIEPLRNLQIIHLDNSKDLYETVKVYNRKKSPDGTTVRTLPDGKDKMLALRLSHHGGLQVLRYTRFVTIYKGQLLPITDGTKAFYDSQLNLEPGIHTVRFQPYSTCRIQVPMNGDVNVAQFKGYTHSLLSQEAVESVASCQTSLMATKNIERFFVDRTTDPFYKNCLKILEKAKMENFQDPHGVTKAIAGYEYGRKILDDVFQGDRLLEKLLREISQKIDLARRPKDGPNQNQSFYSDVRPLQPTQS